MSEKTSCGIYLISPPQFILDEFVKDVLDALGTGLVSAFQLRMKDIEKQEIYNIGKTLLSYCNNHGIQFILNDDVEMAKEIGADGVHIGSSDSDVKRARKILGENKLIGVSCYNDKDRAIDMASSGADYVSFGAFYETSTKKDVTKAEIATLEWWVRNSTVPCVAIGGINSENVGELVNAGADFIAVISYVWGNPLGIVKALENLQDSIEKNVISN